MDQNNEDNLRNAQYTPTGNGMSERPLVVRIMERIQELMIMDQARIAILRKMGDGAWHDLTSLWRVAKKSRPIGLVGVGMALNKLQEGLGFQLFDVNGQDSGAVESIDSCWKVKDEYMGIIRAVLGMLDHSPGGQENLLKGALGRRQYRVVDRDGFS
ncbi:MAG: hypothetical protein ACTSVI_12830 [Promethearchaeota archaeon]